MSDGYLIPSAWGPLLRDMAIEDEASMGQKEAVEQAIAWFDAMFPSADE